MNRFISTLAVSMMAIVAIAICVRQTLDMRESFGNTPAGVLILLQSILAVGILVAVASLVRRRLIHRRPSLTRGRFEFVQPLRRLLSSVWS